MTNLKHHDRFSLTCADVAQFSTIRRFECFPLHLCPLQCVRHKTLAIHQQNEYPMRRGSWHQLSLMRDKYAVVKRRKQPVGVMSISYFDKSSNWLRHL
jgi:hypothetical protein